MELGNARWQLRGDPHGTCRHSSLAIGCAQLGKALSGCHEAHGKSLLASTELCSIVTWLLLQANAAGNEDLGFQKKLKAVLGTAQSGATSQLEKVHYALSAAATAAKATSSPRDVMMSRDIFTLSLRFLALCYFISRFA